LKIEPRSGPMALSFDTLRTGNKYYLQNYGEKTEFEIMKVIGENDFLIKDLLTLDTYLLSDLVKYGKGDDYALWELEKTS